MDHECVNTMAAICRYDAAVTSIMLPLKQRPDPQFILDLLEVLGNPGNQVDEAVNPPLHVALPR